VRSRSDRAPRPPRAALPPAIAIDDGAKTHDDDGAYLRVVGERVRELRAQRGMTRRMLARDSGISERYLAQLETGAGNPTITVVRALARAFGIAPDALIVEGHLAPLAETIIGAVRDMDSAELQTMQRLMRSTLARGEPHARDRRIALIGLRGAGKTTLGTLLAERLAVPFIELDREVERDAGVDIAEIFEFYGQAGFRRHERNSFERILETQTAFVLATGGSIVSESLTFERVLATCFTVWLSAAPAEHMERVIAQGDMRPMAGNREAMDDLQRILAGREALYRRADIEISTSRRSIDATLAALIAQLPQR
jgi:XRE family aerobic/anaerobic benzoate catabolism transcriptional regulator